MPLESTVKPEPCGSIAAYLRHDHLNKTVDPRQSVTFRIVFILGYVLLTKYLFDQFLIRGIFFCMGVFAPTVPLALWRRIFQSRRAPFESKARFAYRIRAFEAAEALRLAEKEGCLEAAIPPELLAIAERYAEISEQIQDDIDALIRLLYPLDKRVSLWEIDRAAHKAMLNLFASISGFEPAHHRAELEKLLPEFAALGESVHEWRLGQERLIGESLSKAGPGVQPVKTALRQLNARLVAS